ncbi:hypothetical protein [Hydrogenimonas sp.]
MNATLKFIFTAGIAVVTMTGCSQRTLAMHKNGHYYYVNTSKCKNTHAINGTTTLVCLDSTGAPTGELLKPLTDEQVRFLKEQHNETVRERKELGRQMAEAGKNIADMNKQNSITIYDYR